MAVIGSSRQDLWKGKGMSLEIWSHFAIALATLVLELESRVDAFQAYWA